MRPGIAIICLLFVVACPLLHGQTIWSENFTYPDSTVIGSNNNTANAAVDWNVVCPMCTTGTDWFKTISNQLNCRDTNGPATFTSEQIDISSYPSGVEFSVDISGSGPLEGCAGSCGCNCVDWIRIQYSINGGSFIDCTHANGGACTNGCSGDTYVVLGSVTPFTFTECPLAGNTLQIRIQVQTWADDEFYSLDNLEVNPTSCGPLSMDGDLIVSASEDEVIVEYKPVLFDPEMQFFLEKSSNGLKFQETGYLPQITERQIRFADPEKATGSTWYRIKIIDSNGKKHYSDAGLYDGHSSGISVTHLPSTKEIQIKGSDQTAMEIRLVDLTGRIVISKGFNQAELNLSTEKMPSGIYILWVRQGPVVKSHKLVLSQ